MSYRQCEEHGWLHIEEYTVSATGGAIICPICELELTGHRDDYSPPPGPDNRPREEFVTAANRYNVRAGRLGFAQYLSDDEMPSDDEMLVDAAPEDN